jgi:murein DD-endopeptidase MepM/ murein hydrolase activator NlpD
LGISALLAATLCVALGVPQSSARANTPLTNGSKFTFKALTFKALRALPPLDSHLTTVRKLTREVRAELLTARTTTRNTKSAIERFKRARMARIARDFSRPTSNYRLTAGFGDRSWLWATPHTGQDFAAPYGTPVKAAESGRVVFAGWDGGYGWKIAIAHANGIQTWYGHLSRINAKVGQHVQVGQFIGRVGASGHATGAHLHFEVQRYGVPINPVKWLRAVGIWV